jgi:putative SOS response-associated peptidase YedK
MCNLVCPCHDIDAVRSRFGVVDRHCELKPSGMLGPGGTLPVIRRGPVAGSCRLDLMRWGLVSAWSRDVLVVRSHIHCTEADELAPSGHCLVPVEKFAERRIENKQPFTVALANGEIMAIAAVWRIWHSPLGEQGLRFALLTTPSNEMIAAFGKRMPAILGPEDWDAWLDETSHGLPEPQDSALLVIRPARTVNAPSG